MNDWGVDNSMQRFVALAGAFEFVITDSGANVKKEMALVSNIH